MVVPPQVDYTWQADLVEMQDPKLIAQNKRTRYLLTVIDVLSKYAWVIALKSKKGKATADAFRYLLENSGGRKPVNLQTDQGKEFYNQHMTRLLDEYNIQHYSTRGEPKAAVAERFNRTLKEWTYKYMTAYNTPKYLDVLPLLVKKYNTRIHSRTQMAPADVTDNNASVVWNPLYKPTPALAPYKFRPGDFLRISKSVKGKKSAFTKSYRGNWSQDVYVVTERQRSLYDGVYYYQVGNWER